MRGAQDGVDRDQKDGDEDGVEHLARACTCSHGGGTPEGGGCVQAVDIATVFHDGTGPEEADTGDDVGDDLSGPGSDGEPQIDECGCPKADQGVGPEAGSSLSPLTLCAYAGAKNKSYEEVRESWADGSGIQNQSTNGARDWSYVFLLEGLNLKSFKAESLGPPK